MMKKSHLTNLLELNSPHMIYLDGAEHIGHMSACAALKYIKFTFIFLRYIMKQLEV